MALSNQREEIPRDELLRRMMNTPHKPQKPKSGGAKAKASRKRKGKRASSSAR
jgi:hypothetical protein